MTKNSFKLLPAFILILLLPSRSAFAFPEMIRAGYTSCITCHVSPNGGGVINPYGRESSKEVLSTWSTENEAKPFYNLFKQPDWIDTQAFIRGVQTAQDNVNVSQGHHWFMEFTGEAAAKFGADQRWTADFTLGISPDVVNGLQIPGNSPLLSSRHYLMYRLNENTTLRAGKFIADFGIYFQDHTSPTRQGIGFDQGQETYNLEYSYQGETFYGSLTADLGRIDNPSLLTEKGVALTGAIAPSERYKVGWSAYYGTQNGNTRQLTGPNILLGFTKRLYLIGEVDLQFAQTVGFASTRGLFSFMRLGYEFIQGLHLYLVQTNSIYDFADHFNPQNINPVYGIYYNRLYAVGPGIYWYPRPHFYFQIEVQQQTSPSLPSGQTSGFLTANIYL